MAASVLMIATMNMLAKLLSPTFIPPEIVFYRSALCLFLLIGYFIISKNLHLVKTTRLKSHLFRSVIGTIGVNLMFLSFSMMPMADTTALLFTGGLMTTAMSALFLKEHVGRWRWGAVCFGMIGAVIIANPSGDFNALGVATALLAAFCGGGLVNIFLRSLGQTEHSLTTVFYFLLVGLVLTAPVVGIRQNWPTSFDLSALLCVSGLVGGLAVILKTEAFRFGEASVLSPIYYTGIIWATFFGWIIWGDVPGSHVILGASLVIISNCIILWREHTKQISRVTGGDINSAR